ncbi:protein IWS1 homolog isoform X2 [Echeneis naucrates]|uniref:protein IWS1 homolog isoform X2 n=1 Tax=Echeneis naucrates TaxID=173247 RepID=UPI001113D4B8|nr:protein IWS1 homolog isoform X2 [Echeneis naucrates]
MDWTPVHCVSPSSSSVSWDWLPATRNRISGNMNDGGGTPVMDEHPASDVEEGTSDKHQSEDEGSNDENAPNALETSGAASGSDNENHQRVNSDSEGEAPRSHDDGNKSDSEAEAPRPADSDNDNSPVKSRMSRSDNEEELPVKHAASDDNEEGEGIPAVRHRGSTSDIDEGEDCHKTAADSDSDNDDTKKEDSNRSNADSDSDKEMPARCKATRMDSEDEEEDKQHQEQEAEGVGGEGAKWKAVMHSDSEEEEGGRRKVAVESDEEQQEEEREQRDDSDDEKPVKRKKAILSDSEEEEKDDKPVVKKSRAVSEDENSGSDGASGGPDKSLAAKLRELGSDSSSDDERSKATTAKKDEKALFGSDSDSGDDDEEEKMIADIFGESGDEEEEEFTGFNQEDLEGDKKDVKEKHQHLEEESDSDEGVDRSGQDTSFMSDFDIMLARRKAMNSRKRRHRDGGTFISDADDVVSAMITKMNEAAEEDRTLNSQKKPALKKLTLLPQVVMHLKKQDLKETFIDSGVMSAIKEWISPLPDKSLPALRIREELLRILQELPSVSQETLKHSGIGRAVMFLYKHPKESRPNKDLALKLINEWSRPIFGLTSNYKGMTREERQQRDLDQQMPQRRRLSSGGQTPRRDLEKQLTGEEKALRPGDPGFCARARVPMPSNKDYVVRPKWNVEVDSNRGPAKKGLSRVDKQMRRFADIRRLTKTGHAVKISVEGNRMPL